VNEGLVLLAAWAQWFAVLVALIWLVARPGHPDDDGG
jgi:hypothetical protein